MWIDISNNAGTKLGDGPLINIGKWRYTMKLSRAGEWSFDIPASDKRLQFAQLKRWVNCYALLGGVKTWFGGGVLEKRTVTVRGQEAPIVTLSGNDTLYDLMRYTARNADGTPIEIDAGSPYLGNGVYGRVMATAVAGGWSYSIVGTTPNMTVRFVDESVLGALNTLTSRTGQMFRLAQPAYSDTTSKSLLIFSDITSSGIMATNLVADPQAIDRNPNACLIVDIEQLQDASGMVNLLRPYGVGTGQTRLTTACTTVWPDGMPIAGPHTILDDMGRAHTFTIDSIQNILRDTGSIDTNGEYPGREEFKDIAPVTNNPADMTAAANALLAAAVRSLLNSSIPQEHYAISVAGLNRMVYPGQSIRVVAREMVDGRTPINIDENLIIQEVTTEIDASGVRPVGLVVATTREFAQTDAQILVSEIKKSIAFQSHPQTGPNSFTVSYERDIDDDYGSELRFWLSRDTAQINSIILRFTLSQMRSTVKSVGGKVDAHFNLPDHSHTLGDHTHSLTGHQHNIQFPPASGGYTVQIFSGGGSPDVGSIGANGAPHDIFVNTNAVTGSTSSASNTAISVGGGAVADANLDLSDAITADYGIYEDPDPAHTLDELRWTVNIDTVTETPTDIGLGWYELDITRYIIDATLTKRPRQQANVVTVAVIDPKTDPLLKRNVHLDAQIEVRNIIQSLAVV